MTHGNLFVYIFLLDLHEVQGAVRNATGEESTAYNMVTEKKYLHICLCSVPFCADCKMTQLREEKIQSSKLRMTVEVSLQTS